MAVLRVRQEVEAEPPDPAALTLKNTSNLGSPHSGRFVSACSGEAPHILMPAQAKPRGFFHRMPSTAFTCTLQTLTLESGQHYSLRIIKNIELIILSFSQEVILKGALAHHRYFPVVFRQRKQASSRNKPGPAPLPVIASHFCSKGFVCLAPHKKKSPRQFLCHTEVFSEPAGGREWGCFTQPRN